MAAIPAGMIENTHAIPADIVLIMILDPKGLQDRCVRCIIRTNKYDSNR